jgi:hypothetical protein
MIEKFEEVMEYGSRNSLMHESLYEHPKESFG